MDKHHVEQSNSGKKNRMPIPKNVQNFHYALKQNSKEGGPPEAKSTFGYLYFGS